MKFTKNKIIMLSIGGIVAVVVVVAIVMVLSALSEKAELDESLMMAEGTFRKYSKAEISPTQESEKALKENYTVLSNWFESARAEASVGDMSANSAMNEASFKQKMVDDAREFSKLPGIAGLEDGAKGALVKSGFGFGFPQYITEGNLPPRERLAALQKQWADITLFIGIFARAEVSEILRIDVLSQAPAPQVQDEQPRRQARGKDKSVQEVPLCVEEKYMIELTAKPNSLIKILNELQASKRFVIVDSLEFARQTDLIAAAIAGDSAKPADGKGARKSRRGRRQAVEAEAVNEGATPIKKKGFVIEPRTETPFTVKLTLVTCDFGTAGAPKAAELSEEKQEVE
ncbi:MAG: Amuc_1100 family pilus-like protein [Kiritimatiellae bacterium]|nr:Amuc_1100 family pilus-like protein [Kiritimatiellia bacterium]